MTTLVTAFLISAIATLLVIRSAHRHERFSIDHAHSGPQKFHTSSVPRVGGAGILVAVAGALGIATLFEPDLALTALGLIACGLPAFAAGMTEDLTKRVTPRVRLLATAVSAALAGWFLDAMIVRTDLPGLDWVVSFSLGAALVTVFVVAGVANAVNIIDGFNGLASMCVMLMLCAIAYVAWQVDDRLVMLCALAAVGAVLGFFVWNFPAGLIFLGDGGAYFLGFLLAELAILLLARNAEVSPMLPLLVCIYPVVETVFSIYRRRVLRDHSPAAPDGIHLHSLIYRRVTRRASGWQREHDLTRCNSITSPYLWILCALSLVPAVLWWDSTPILGVSILAFAAVYVYLYWRIVRFRVPVWMRRAARRDFRREAAHGTDGFHP